MMRGLILFMAALLAATASASAASDPFWTLAAQPAGVSLVAGQPLSVAVSVGENAADGVRILQDTILEASRKFAASPLGWRVCLDAAGKNCPVPLDLAAKSSAMLWLWPVGSAPTAGHFTGNAVLAATDHWAGDPVAFDFYVSNIFSKEFALLPLVLGVVVAWCISVLAKAATNRAQLLMPAALYRARLARLHTALAVRPANGPAFPVQTLRQITALLDRLSDARLEAAGYIPSSLPSPFSNPQNNADAYKLFMSTTDAWVAVLESIVNAGIVPAWGEIPPTAPPAHKAALATCVSAIDAVVVQDAAPSLASVETAISAALRALHAATMPVAAHDVAAVSSPLLQRVPTDRSYEYLKVETQVVSSVVWVAIGVITTAIGYYVEVLQNLGFGVGTDYFVCFFWGLGLPVGAGQLVALTASSASTSLGITYTKGAPG